MRGTIISINDNDRTTGKLVASNKAQLFIYNLPETINVGEKVLFSIRVSRKGNEYAVYLEPYSRTSIQVDTIDFEKRMTSMEHLVLYYYQLIKNNKRADYSDEQYKDWILKEELIETYNIDDEDIKMDTADISNQSFEMFNKKFITEIWNYEKPVIWKDRKKTKYFINQLIDSHRFELFVDTLFKKNGIDIGLYYGRNQQYSGETRLGIEIKLDKKLKYTKNVYIEYQERMNREGIWVNSGILKSDNTKMFFIGDVEKYYILSKKRLLQYYNRLILNGEEISGIRIAEEKEHGTSKGFIMNEQIVLQENISINEAIIELGEDSVYG